MSRGRNTESGAAQGARRATEAAPDSARRGKVRWSARRKVTVVLELMRGVELEATSRKYAVTAATLTSWRDAFLQGGEDGLPWCTNTGKSLIPLTLLFFAQNVTC